MKKRSILSPVLVLVATVFGVAMSFTPAIATALESNRYVALGDSVAAGQGLLATSGTDEDAVCGRSTAAYPYRVANSLGMSVEHLACSGAKADEGLYGSQQRQAQDIEPQIDRAFAAGVPDVITVTIGANDLRWSKFIQQCYLWDCGGSVSTAAATAYLADLRWELYHTLNLIAHKSDETPPKVVFTGYFLPFNPSGPACTETRNFTPHEMMWLNNQAERLNKVIQNSVAWYDFAEYAPVDFAGHELCSAHPWIQGAQSAAPFHPTTVGQMAIGRSVVATIRD